MADEDFTLEDQASETPDVSQAQQAAPSVDYAALEAQVSEIAPGMTLPNLIDSYKEARSTLGRYQNMDNEFSRLKRDYEVAEPLIKGIKENAEFAQHMTQAAQEFYQGTDRSVDSGVQNALNPLQHKLQDIEVRLAERDMSDQVTSLKNDPNFGKFLTKEVEREMWQKVQDTGMADMQTHFWAVAGPKIVQASSKQATTDTAESIRKANASYAPLDGSGSPQKGQVTPPEDASPDEVIDAIAQMMGGG